MYPNEYDNIDTTWANDGTTVGPEVILLYQSPTIITVNSKYPIKRLLPIPGFTEVVNSPASGQYRVYYNTTQIQFGPIPYPVSATLTYVTLGTIFDANHINTMSGAINAIETTLGLNPQGSYPSVAARLGVLESSSTDHPVIDRYVVSAYVSGDYQVVLTEPATSSAVLVFRDAELLDALASPPEYTVTGNLLTLSSTINIENLDIITVQYFG